MLACEDEPVVEQDRTAFTTFTRPNPKGGRNALEGIAKADVLISDKFRQAYAMRLVFAFVWKDVFLICSDHEAIYLLT